MKIFIRIFVAISSVLHSGLVLAVGAFPVPQITDVTFKAELELVTGFGDPEFVYTYSISSGAGNTGDISHFFIDIKTRVPKNNFFPDDFEYSKPLGKVNTNVIMDRYDSYRKPSRTRVEFVGTDLPQYWNSNPTKDGFLLITPPSGGILDENGEFTGADLISPGETVSNLVVRSISVPTLREVVIIPDWYLIVDDEAEGELLHDQAIQVMRDLQIKVPTIAPSTMNFTGVSLAERLAGDIEEMDTLGWIPDQSLLSDIQSKMTQIIDFLKGEDGTQAKLIYQQLKDQIDTVTESQIRREGIDLISVVASIQSNFIPDTATLFEPDLSIDPTDIELEIGNKVTFDPKFINLADNNAEIEFFRGEPFLEVLTGPNAGLVIDGNLVPPGEAFGYTSSKVGLDEVLLASPDEDDGFGLLNQIVLVNWTGGADYVISFFSPPFLEYRGDEAIFVLDATKNIGITDAGVPTTTRYYLSESSDFDIETAFQLTERIVPPLGPDTENESGLTEVIWPSQFPVGTYYFAACVDADNEVYETNELNNCSFHLVRKVAYRVFMIGEEMLNTNIPPVCDNAIAVPSMLWPPNHKFKNITIEGVTDVDQDSVTIEVTMVTQDEPVDDLGSGNTSPDGKGVGTPTASVRAERSGTGDGRVYAIHFTATDSVGNQCMGTVTAGAVVHNQGPNGDPAIDSGQVYDSTIEF